MTTVLFFKIILMFAFFFGLIGFIISPFMELKKMEKVAGWSFLITLLSLVGILFLSNF